MPVDWNNQAVQAAVRKGAMAGVVRCTEAVKQEAIRLILQTEKSGRVYHRRGITHTASAPGEPPASDTGRLVSSIRTSYDFASLSGEVLVQAAYGVMLEYGTLKMEPRPYLRPALAKASQDFTNMIKDEIIKALQGYGG